MAKGKANKNDKNVKSTTKEEKKVTETKEVKRGLWVVVRKALEKRRRIGQVDLKGEMGETGGRV